MIKFRLFIGIHKVMTCNYGNVSGHAAIMLMLHFPLITGGGRGDYNRPPLSEPHPTIQYSVQKLCNNRVTSTNDMIWTYALVEAFHPLSLLRIEFGRITKMIMEKFGETCPPSRPHSVVTGEIGTKQCNVCALKVK